MRLSKHLACVLAVALMAAPMRGETIPEKLQSVSVTVHAQKDFRGGSGSGTLVTREISVGDEKKQKVTFILTAGHVIRALRSVRTVIDPDTGTERKVIEFADAELVTELKQAGRKVGEVKMKAKVLKYSDAENGEDLALLMVRKTDYVDVSAEFYLKEDIPPIGTELYHVGSLLGQIGANSLTTGIISQIGRLLPLGAQQNTVFDQTTVTAFPGSSGGGVFRKSDGKYLGMLVRGRDETFNFIVPIRRIKDWTKAAGIAWAIDPELPSPCLDDIIKMRPETIGVKFNTKEKSASVTSGE